MENNQKTKLILFCGLPGSGKTTLAKFLESRHQGIRICTDDWQADLEVQAHSVDDTFHEKLQKRLYKLALELLSTSQDVILEDGLWMQQERAEKLQDAKKYGAATVLHYFDISLEEIWKRLESRNKDLPHGAIHITREDLQKCWDIYQKPTHDELAGFDEVYIHTDAMAVDESKQLV